MSEKWVIDKMKSTVSEECMRSAKIDELVEFDKTNENEMRTIQFLVTLGGDGTILYAAKQFHGDYIPPIISFAMVRWVSMMIIGFIGLSVQFRFRRA